MTGNPVLWAVDQFKQVRQAEKLFMAKRSILFRMVDNMTDAERAQYDLRLKGMEDK